jgi:type VI protein secretion system component VasF
MIFAFLVASTVFTAFLFTIWNTEGIWNVLIHMYLLLLTVYFGYSTFMHETFQTLLK